MHLPNPDSPTLVTWCTIMICGAAYLQVAAKVIILKHDTNTREKQDDLN